VPSTLPYNPTKRITPADSMLIPLSQIEMRMYRNYCGKGASKLLKRKRSASDEPEQQPAKRHAGDVGLVVDHCTSYIDHTESPELNCLSDQITRGQTLASCNEANHLSLASKTLTIGSNPSSSLDLPILH
jgi:hypothetical protein